MKTSVTRRGQTVIQAKVRRAHRIGPKTRIEWIDDGQTIRGVPLSEDPIAAARGIAKGLRVVLLRDASTNAIVSERYVLDTSAILAFLGGDPGADREKRPLGGGRVGRHGVCVCAITLMELSYTAMRVQGEDAAFRLVALVKAWPLEWVYTEILLQAGRLKASRRLSVAEALIAALACIRAATLVHKDPELDP